MAMLDYQTYRPFGAPDQMGASQMFRNKPANSALQGALNAGGIPTPTQTPYSNTGVSGRATGGVPGYRPSMPAPAPQAPAPVDYSRAGSFLPGHGSGYNPEKDLVNGAGTSGKYKMRNVLSHFDPKLGLQQAGLMDALNSAGIGHFRAIDGDELVGDHLDPSFGRTTKFDVIGNYDSGNGKWGYLQQDKGGVMGGGRLPAMMPTQSPYLDASQIASLGAQPGQNYNLDQSNSMLQQILQQLQDPSQMALKKALAY